MPNRGAAGVDKQSIAMFESNLDANLDSLMRALKGWSSRPRPLLRHFIEKWDGKLRPVGIPVVRDRVAQAVLRALLAPIFERGFHDSSHGFRPRRSCHTAMEELMGHIRKQAEKALELVRRIIEDELELTLHPQKTRIVPLRERFDFLGFRITPFTVRMGRKAEDRFKDKIRQITRRSHNLDAEVIRKLNVVIRGTVNYFNTAFTTNLAQFNELDQWIRRRVRCMKFKRISQKDNCRLENRHIRRLGLVGCRECVLGYG